jgi:hypothetical protein
MKGRESLAGALPKWKRTAVAISRPSSSAAEFKPAANLYSVPHGRDNGSFLWQLPVARSFFFLFAPRHTN